MLIIDPVPANQQDTSKVRAFMAVLVLGWRACFPEGRPQTDRGADASGLPLTSMTFGSELTVQETDVNEGPEFGTGARWDCWRDNVDDPATQSFQLGLDDTTFTRPITDTCQAIATALYTQDWVKSKVAGGMSESAAEALLQGAAPADYKRPVAIAQIGPLFNSDGSRNSLTF